VPIYTSGGTNITGHTFALDTKGCALGGCHTTSVPDWQGFQNTTSNSLISVVNLLNQWATNNGPTLFGANYTNYLQNAWEFTTPGSLATITNPGPSKTDQVLLPNAIKQARFDLYMVQNDGSYGVHNPGYVPFLLSDATTKVNVQLNFAFFTASATKGNAPFTPTFTCWGSGITSYNWDFGDGHTSTLASPTNTYAGSGTYTVTLTATTASRTNTYVSANYISVYNVPVPSFIAGPTTGTAPLTVTFTNTSTSTNDVTAWRWTFKGGVSGSPTSTNMNTSFTYTNAGTYSVYLRATTPGGNITKTNLNYIIATP
jgi:PKD repeat protein